MTLFSESRFAQGNLGGASRQSGTAAGGSHLRVWIDATDPRSTLPVFGMSLLERQLRALLQAGLEPTEICIEIPSGTSSLPILPPDLSQRLPLRWSRDGAQLPERLARAVGSAAGEPVIALEADSIVDSRLLRHIADGTGPLAARGGEGAERAAALRLEGSVPRVGGAGSRLYEVANAGIADGSLTEVAHGDVPDYIANLRRRLPTYLFRITDEASRDRAERFLFRSNYKGSTDFFTKHVYPPIVWRAVRWLARRRVHPNTVTLFNVLITLAAVPLFAQGHWVLGLTIAYTMSVLDSVDGKLARLTFQASRMGNILDHGLDLVHPPLWYFAWAWALGGGNPAAPVLQAAVWMVFLYFLDRIVIRIFNRRTGRSIHAYTPLDVQLRTFISRRNINVPIFTVGLLAGAPIPAFYLIVAWQVVTLAFHGVQLARFWNVRKPTAAAT
jgi:phosphatidylglycerophosphate synthase